MWRSLLSCLLNAVSTFRKYVVQMIDQALSFSQSWAVWLSYPSRDVINGMNKMSRSGRLPTYYTQLFCVVAAIVTWPRELPVLCIYHTSSSSWDVQILYTTTSEIGILIYDSVFTGSTKFTVRPELPRVAAMEINWYESERNVQFIFHRERQQNTRWV